MPMYFSNLNLFVLKAQCSFSQHWYYSYKKKAVIQSLHATWPSFLPWDNLSLTWNCGAQCFSFHFQFPWIYLYVGKKKTRTKICFSSYLRKIPTKLGRNPTLSILCLPRLTVHQDTKTQAEQLSLTFISTWHLGKLKTGSYTYK